ncbi:hypothetical protein F5Y15DRAFT_166946 [Xylariaceae sp. FL0016]|nr:hypothetical protein F5Y15DRAFT_166946 [Xylariaceae sp. FL0016]
MASVAPLSLAGVWIRALWIDIVSGLAVWPRQESSWSPCNYRNSEPLMERALVIPPADLLAPRNINMCKVDLQCAIQGPRTSGMTSKYCC